MWRHCRTRIVSEAVEAQRRSKDRSHRQMCFAGAEKILSRCSATLKRQAQMRPKVGPEHWLSRPRGMIWFVILVPPGRLVPRGTTLGVWPRWTWAVIMRLTESMSSGVFWLCRLERPAMAHMDRLDNRCRGDERDLRHENQSIL